MPIANCELRVSLPIVCLQIFPRFSSHDRRSIGSPREDQSYYQFKLHKPAGLSLAG
jgi:hypothetical protein